MSCSVRLHLSDIPRQIFINNTQLHSGTLVTVPTEEGVAIQFSSHMRELLMKKSLVPFIVNCATARCDMAWAPKLS